MLSTEESEDALQRNIESGTLDSSEMIDMTRTAGETFYQQNYARVLQSPTGNLSESITVNGLEYQVFLKTVDGRIVIDNVHLI